MITLAGGRLDDPRQAVVDHALGRRPARLLDPDAVREERQHALVAQSTQEVPVGGLAVRRGRVELEITGVKDRAHRRVDREADRARHTVVDVDRFDLKGADRERLTGLHRVGDNPVKLTVLTQLVPDQPERHRRAVNRQRVDLTKLHQQEGQTTDVVFVAVGKEHAFEAVTALGHVHPIRDHQVDAVKLLLRKLHPGIDQQELLFPLEEG